MKKILFLDFDGVLFDTVEEAYQVCINTDRYKNINLPTHSLKLFKRFRPLVGPAWNYLYIMEAILYNLRVEDNSTFKYTKEAIEFEKDFFNTRKVLKTKNYQLWLKSNKKYSFLDGLEDLQKSLNFVVYIITTKDRQTVIDLLNEYNIKFIDSNKILGKDSFNQYGSKKDIILNILSSENNYKAIFIDDLYEHLKLCRDIQNLNLIQASWGYCDIFHNSKYLYSAKEALKIIDTL